MIFDQVRVVNFRNILQGYLPELAQVNYLYGENGSGKTSVLEALYYFGYGKSFRTSSTTALVNHSSQAFHIFATGRNCNDEAFKVGVERNQKGKFDLKVNGVFEKRLSNLVSLFPVQLYTPQSTDDFTSNSAQRRKLIDWAMFHVEPCYGRLALDYNLALRSRNALLKHYTSNSPHDGQMDFWEKKLSEIGNQITIFREKYILSITSHLMDCLHCMNMKFEDVSVEYKSGLGVGEKKAYNYLDILQQKRSVDIRAGHTTAGPHRADLIVKVNGVIASNLLSRGQLRLLISSLKLAQNKHLAKESGKMCVVLIDDLAAELDQKSSYSFFSELLKTNCQLFITSIERNQLPKIPVEVEQKLFHVKHGYITTEEK